MSVNFGLPYLIVHNVDSSKWCERYDLQPFTGECHDCGKEALVLVPFVTKNKRGLCADTCSCGSKSVPFSYIDLRFPL